MDPKYCIRYLMQDGKYFLKYLSISSIPKVNSFYQALIYFEKMLMDPKYCIRYLMQDGKYFKVFKYYSSTIEYFKKYTTYRLHTAFVERW